MSELIRADNISEAWVNAMEYLLAEEGTTSNLIIAIAPEGVGKEIKDARGILDDFFERHKSKSIRSIRKVADTIFPTDLYKNGPGAEARARLYRQQQLASRVEKREGGDRYIDRLIEWPWPSNAQDTDQPGQLERLVLRLKKRYEAGYKTWNAYELGTAIPEEELEGEQDCVECGDLRIQDPARDRGEMGFPCLSHISITLCKGKLDMTAVYRNQHYVRKAYGNFVGLSDLLRFITVETGCAIGELVCVATHADAEIGKVKGIGKAEVEGLVHECRESLYRQADSKLKRSRRLTWSPNQQILTLT